MVGLVESLAHVTRATFRADGDTIVLLGEPRDEIGGSEYLARIHDTVAGLPPRVDLDAERRLVDALLAAIAAGHVASAHDCSDGGFAVALAECCMADPDTRFGADVDVSAWSSLPPRAVLFGETHGRVIVSTSAPDAVVALARQHGVSARAVGRVVDDARGLTVRGAGVTLRSDLNSLADAYHDAIPRIMDRSPAASGA
jgi:phosphoribosylformylglycinamidine (FGAM) synthase-like enzyme